MANPGEESHFKLLPPTEFICASCKRKQVAEPDEVDDHASDAAHKRLKLEANDNDISALAGACFKTASTKECMENDKDSTKDHDHRDKPLRESAEDELRQSISPSTTLSKSSFVEMTAPQNDFGRSGHHLFMRFSSLLLRFATLEVGVCTFSNVSLKTAKRKARIRVS